MKQKRKSNTKIQYLHPPVGQMFEGGLGIPLAHRAKIRGVFETVYKEQLAEGAESIGSPFTFADILDLLVNARKFRLLPVQIIREVRG